MGEAHLTVVSGVTRVGDGLERGDGVAEFVCFDLERKRRGDRIRVPHDPDAAHVRLAPCQAAMRSKPAQVLIVASDMLSAK